MITQREMDLMELEAEAKLTSMFDNFMEAWLGDRSEWLDTDNTQEQMPTNLSGVSPEQDITRSLSGIPGTQSPMPPGQLPTI
jgi:hypothetical protein